MSSFSWALCAAFCWGVAPLFEKMGLRGSTDPVVGVVVRSVGVLLGTLCFLPFMSRISTSLAEMTPRTWIFLGLGGLIASVIGQLCFYHALKTGDVSRVVPLGASYPVLACIIGILFLREPMSWSKVSGIVLVVAGTFLLR